MGTPQLLVKRSAVQNKVPTTAQMVVGEIALNTYDGALYVRGNNGADFVRQIGGAAYPDIRQGNWQPVSGLAPVLDYEFDEQVYKFAQGSAQAITTWFQVPSFYTAGRQLILRVGVYSPSSANVFRLSVNSTLVRAGVDAVTSTTNSLTSTPGDTTLATGYLLNKLSFNLTDASGLVNAVAVSPGDILKVVLSRVTPTGTDDLNDVRVIPSSAEVQC